MPIIFLPNEYLEYELHSRADDADGDLWWDIMDVGVEVETHDTASYGGMFRYSYN